jgi:hypothetical protein
VRRANYAEISEFYDEGRRLSERNIELWLDFVNASEQRKGRRFSTSDVARAGSLFRWLGISISRSLGRTRLGRCLRRQ